MKLKLYLVAGLFLVCVVSAIIFDVLDNTKKSGDIEITKTRCIEICTETLLKKGVFPSDFHETIKKCEMIFDKNDSCTLSAKGK